MEEGSLATDFSVQDISGSTRNLYEKLDSGKTVILSCFAAWDSYAWEYYQQQTLDNFNALYGSSGSGAVEVWRVECETSNTPQQLFGPAASNGNPMTDTQGDWLALSTLPVIDDSSFAAQLSLPYLPMLIVICPDRLVRFADQLSLGNLTNLVFQSACPPAVQGIDPALVSASISRTCGSNEIQLDVVLKNLGTDTLFNTDIKLDGAVNTQIRSWQGQLNPYQSDTISIPSLQIVTDAPINCSIDQVNARTENDSLFVRTDVGYSTRLIRLELALDAYPEEVWWEIKDDTGAIIYDGGGYSVDYQYLNQVFHLPSVGCYSFYLYDSAGDGLNGSQYGGFDGFCKLSSMIDSTNIEEVMLDYDGSYGFSAFPNSPGFLQYNFEAGSPIQVPLIERQSIRVFPNPAHDFLNIDLVNYSPSALSISDLSGRLVLQERGETAGIKSLDVSALPSGMYFLHMQIRSESVRLPIIIQH
jgi:hypothetical protein